MSKLSKLLASLGKPTQLDLDLEIPEENIDKLPESYLESIAPESEEDIDWMPIYW